MPWQWYTLIKLLHEKTMASVLPESKYLLWNQNSRLDYKVYRITTAKLLNYQYLQKE